MGFLELGGRREDPPEAGPVIEARQGAHASGQIGAITQELGIRSAVGAPIVVEGQPWGVMIATSNEDEPLPAGTESIIQKNSNSSITAVTPSNLSQSRIRQPQQRLQRHRVLDLPVGRL